MVRRRPQSPKTYDQALRRPSRRIWPGCGDGRRRPCGRIHDFSRRITSGPNGQTETVHDFRCARNHRSGCPNPIPPEEGEAS